MKRQLSTIFLALCLALTLPTMALADGGENGSAETHANHCVCGASHSYVGDHRAEYVITEWKKLTLVNNTLFADGTRVTTENQYGTDYYKLGSGNYYLAGQDTAITLNIGLYVPAGETVNLCLNGKTLNTGGKKNQIAGTLNITDCQTTAGKITGAANSTESLLYISGGTVNLYRVELSGNAINQKGGAVYIYNSGKFNMYGGAIKDNSADDGGGVAVLTSCVFNMYDGSISNNTATGSNGGGGVYVIGGTFNMYGGTITGNTASHQWYGYGGGVSAYGGTFTMSGGSITDNTTTNGWGGGVYVSSATVTLSKEVKITGNKQGTSTTSNVHLAYGKTVNIGTDGLSGNASIGVTTASSPSQNNPVAITGSNSADYSGYFFADNSTAYEVVNDNDVLKLRVKSAGKAEQAAPTGLGAVAPTTFGENDGKITGTTTAMEYSTDQNAWIDCTGTMITDLAAGTYYVRYQETGEKKASDSVAVTVPDGSTPTPTVTVSFNKNCTGDVAGTLTSKTVEKDTGTISDLPTLTRSGFTFSGWYKDAACTAGNEATATTTFSVDTTLYAKWTQNTSSGAGFIPIYTVTVGDTEHGEIKANRSYASGGHTVTLTVTADKDYTLETLTVFDSNGNEIELTDNGDGTYSFKMPHSKVNVTATFTEDNTTLNFFVDVPASAYYYDAVLWAAKNGIADGVNETRFASDLTCTRAQAVTFLWRATGSPEPETEVTHFEDVATDSYYAKAVAWATENGVTVGTSDTTFSPDQTCSRAHIVTFLFRYAAVNGMDAVTLQELVSGFGDAVSVPSYALPAFNWALASGIVQGSDGNLMPTDNCARAQIVTMLYRLLGE